MKIFINSTTIVLISYFINYLIGIILAQHMGPVGFGDYAAAIAWSLIFTIVITLGLEKFSRQIIPHFIENNRWRLYRGFLKYGTRSIAIAGAIFAILFIGCFVTYNHLLPFEHNHPALLTVVLFLPITGIIRFLTELININHGFIHSIIIARLQPALITLFFIILFITMKDKVNPVYAILAYGIGWLTAIPIAIYYLKKLAPHEMWRTYPKYKKDWLKDALPYLISSMAILGSVKCGLLLLEMINVPEAIVGYYAAIDLILFFLVTISLLSNQYFAPKLSFAIHKSHTEKVNEILKIRFRFLLIFLTIFCAAMIVFGRPILSLYGPGFIIGYPALVVGSVLMSITVLLYIASVLLQYKGHQHFIAKNFLLLLLSNCICVIVLAFTINPIMAAAIGISAPAILILGIQNIMLYKRYDILVCSL